MRVFGEETFDTGTGGGNEKRMFGWIVAMKAAKMRLWVMKDLSMLEGTKEHNPEFSGFFKDFDRKVEDLAFG
jgi:hypothetical protein